MAGYSQTPLWKKLGYRAGTRAWVRAAPEGYRAALGLPAEIKVRWLPAKPDDGEPPDFAHVFARSHSELNPELKRLRRALNPDGMLWVSWPKKASRVPTDITEDTLRSAALPLGWVDIKVCAVDDVWSGLKLVIRKELRPK